MAGLSSLLDASPFSGILHTLGRQQENFAQSGRSHVIGYVAWLTREPLLVLGQFPAVLGSLAFWQPHCAQGCRAYSSRSSC